MSTSGSATIEVSHLPSAASFYAEIAQPLGISYLSASGPRINFGWVSQSPAGTPQPHIVLSLQHSTTIPVQWSVITLLANSPAAVENFYQKGLVANSHQTDHTIDHSPVESRARIRDLDGNMLEAVYSARAPGALPRRRTLDMETASTPKEAQRVLQWQQEVARSVALSDREPSPPPSRGPGPVPRGDVASIRDRDGERMPIQYRRSESYPTVSHYVSERPRLVTRETVCTERYHRPSDGEPGGRGGLTGMKLVGTLLGAAAGAAVAYAAVRSDSPPRYDGPRRASYGDPPYLGRPPSYVDPRDIQHVVGSRVERAPARSYISMDPKEPRYRAQYTIAGPPPSRAHDWARIEERSHASRRSGRSEQQVARERSERSRSESGTRYNRPLTVLPPRPRSPQAPSQTSRRSYRSHHSEDRASRRHIHESDRDTYISARSHRTEREDGRCDSAISTTTIRVIPKDERRSVVSARNIPLPESVVGGSRYAESVAPSDSVSSVGGKRERERMRDRMRERW